MYQDLYSEEIAKKLAKLKKKNPVEYSQVRKKMDSILADPTHTYKFLHHDMKGLNRVQLGHFVLVFSIDHTKQTISFEDYDHHDFIYKKK
jgi:mRNA-degrading endonuclease RelE of RelBE toxin-antitoxin system